MHIMDGEQILLLPQHALLREESGTIMKFCNALHNYTIGGAYVNSVNVSWCI